MMKEEPEPPEDHEFCGVKLSNGLLCEQRKGHWADPKEPDKGHGRPWWYCKPDYCPDRDKHYRNAFKGRITEKYGNLTRDGCTTHIYIDGVLATKQYDIERCVCGILLIYKPK